MFVNTALHPAVPPGGALLRTSVMATHDAATIDRALDVFARVKGGFEREHGPLPAPRGTAEREPRRPASPRLDLSISSQVSGRTKSPLLAHEPRGGLLTGTAVLA